MFVLQLLNWFLIKDSGTLISSVVYIYTYIYIFVAVMAMGTREDEYDYLFKGKRNGRWPGT